MLARVDQKVTDTTWQHSSQGTMAIHQAHVAHTYNNRLPLDPACSVTPEHMSRRGGTHQRGAMWFSFGVNEKINTIKSWENFTGESI